jgi:hypothetical protein
LATNFPAESNYQQLTTYNVDLKVNDKARIGSADNTNLEAIANRRIYNIMDKKSKELIRYDDNNSKNVNKLEGLQEKSEKTLKEQKSKSVSNINISKEKTILKAKEREHEKKKDENNVLKNNFFEKPKCENTAAAYNNNNTNNKNNKAVVYSKKGEYNSNQNDSYQINEQINQNFHGDYYNENFDNENLIVSDNDNIENLNIEQTKRQNFITGDSNYNPNNSNYNKNFNIAKAHPKSRSLPKHQNEIKQDMKLKKNNFLENQKKFASNLTEQNMKKLKEQQANKNAKNESAETNSNIDNREKLLIQGRKQTGQHGNNSNPNNNNNQNKSRITNPNEKSNKLEQINKIFTTEEKLENIEKINECFEKLEIKKVERESMDKIKKKVVLVQKKLRVLQERGIELNLDETNNHENEEKEAQKIKNDDNFDKQNKRINEEYNDYENEEEKNYVFHDSDNNIEKENISSKNLNSNSDNDVNKIINNKNNQYHEKEDKLNFDNMSKIKNYNNIHLVQLKKPVVDTLEFVKKIQESRRKFVSKSQGKSEILNRSDSFRRSNSESNNNKNNLISQKNNNFNINDYEENENESNINNKNLQMLTNKLFLASNSHNGSEADKRLKDLEIKHFIERKKKEKKMVELKIQEENRKNWENKVLQLLHLEKTIIIKNEKVNFVKKNNSSSTQNYSRQSNSANKVRNDFYIGNKKPNLNSNLDESSILDPDDFYYTVLESKNIIVTQKSQSSNKVNSVSVKNSNKSTANQLNNNINFKTSEDIQKQNAALSRLSDFTQGNYNENRKSDNNYNFTNGDKNKVTNISNKLSQENFLKFINENEKVTLRSLDSKNSGNNVNNIFYDKNNSNEKIKPLIIKNLNNINTTNYNNTSGFNSNIRDNISNSPLNLKLTTDSKLIGSKSSNFNPDMRKSDNLFENNLENNAKKKHQDQNHLADLSNNDKELSNSPGFEKASSKKTQKIISDEMSDLNNKNSQISEGIINRSDIEKDSFLLQFDNLLVTFANKIKQVYLRKHLPELINNIIMREQIKYCYETLSNLCNVGKRSVFNRIREYSNEVHVENIYSVFNNLTLFAKRNSMNRIFQYFAFVRNLDNSNANENNKESDLEDYENLDTKNIEEIKAQYLTYFVGIIDRLFLLTKKDAIEHIFEHARNFSLSNDLHFSSGDKHDLSSNNLNDENINKNNTQQMQALLTGGESHDESDYSEKSKLAQYYEYIKSAFDLMTRHIRRDAYNKIKAFSEAKKHQKILLNESSRSYNSNNNNTNRDNNSSINSERAREKIILTKKSANGENSFSSVFNQNKANSFIAQSHNSSNFSLHPNSLDSPKIRKLQFKIAQKNLEREWLENIDEKYGSCSGNANNYHNSNASSANENKSNTSFSNNNLDLNLNLHANNSSNFKDNPLVRSDDENEESKNINYSKLSLDDPFKDSKKKFYVPAISNNENYNYNSNLNNDEANKINYTNNNDDNSLISNSNKNKSICININKYSTVNYNDELNLNLGSAVSEAERKKPASENSQIHNNRYGASDNNGNYNYNENSFNSAKSKNKNNIINSRNNLSPRFNRAADTYAPKAPENLLENQKHNNSILSKEADISQSKKAAFDAAGNLKIEEKSPETGRNERESFHEEIVEDIFEDILDNSTRKKNSLKDASGRFLNTDIDLSVGRDNTSDIDWIYNLSQSKSGSLRDVTGGNLVKQFTDLASKNEDNNNINNTLNNKNSNNLLKEKDESVNNNLRNSVSIGYDSDDYYKKSEKDISLNLKINENNKNETVLDNNINKKEELENKMKETQIDRSLYKNTDEDYENNYDDFENIEEDIAIDEETDFAKILGDDSTSNLQHGSLLKSRNSLKNGSLQEEKEKEKHKENLEDLRKGLSQNAEEKEIDLTNKKINLNVIPGKETIDSLKDIKSIESDDNDFFRIKNNNNNQNILNLLDDKSSNNKSVSVNLISHLSPDVGIVSDATSSYNLKDIQLNKETINTDYLTALDKKSENAISTFNRKPDIAASKESLFLPNNNSNLINKDINKRYENIENSAKKTETPSDKEYLSTAEMDSLSSDLAEKIMNDLIENEIKNREKSLIPKKIFKSEAGLINMLNSLNSTPLNRSLVSLDNSMNSTINNTLFSKTVLEQKKENSMKLYIEQIGPKLIEDIVEDITKSIFF